LATDDNNYFSVTGYLGEIIAFVTVLSWTLCILPFTEAARRMGPNAVNHFRLLLASLFLSFASVFWFLWNDITLVSILTGPSFEQWMWLGISGIVGLTLGDYFAFTMYAILGSRTGSLFTTFAPGAALLFGYLLLDERINLAGFAGIIITLSGVAWLTLSRKEKARFQDHGHGKLEKGIIFGILAALCQGSGLVLAKMGMSVDGNEYKPDPLHATWMRMIIATITIYLFSIATGRIRQINQPIRENRNKGLAYLGAGTFFGPVMGVCLSMITITLLQVSVAQTIFALVPVFVLPLAAWIYREKISFESVIGAMIAIGGVMILIWRDEVLQFILK
jgi:drug/metabolite transporter (DMT)-like permease